MAEEPEASALTARRAAQHVRLSSADDAYEHLYILTLRPIAPLLSLCILAILAQFSFPEGSQVAAYVFWIRKENI
jgi:hypothetical protein